MGSAPDQAFNSFVAPHRRISRLGQTLADQIAAGEVVERPASVVKELLENSIDAGALRVDVELEDGGLTCIRVRDNGRGIHPDDLTLAIERHATSKLKGPEDLVEIQTLGFRGEALSSVAAVAHLCIRSRQKDAAVGTELRSVPASAPRITPAGMPVGTQVEVRGLFASVPARRKFMRSEATEVGHCSETVLRTALVHPEVHITLRHGRRELLNLRAGTEAERVEQILQRRCTPPFFAVEGEDRGVAVRAWLAAPESAVRGRSASFIVVRRRVVRDRSLSQILSQSYAGAIPSGKHPVAVLFVEPPLTTVDVNVHPQKAEVRFSEPQRVYAAVRRVLSEGVAGAPWAEGNGAPADELDVVERDARPSAVQARAPAANEDSAPPPPVGQRVVAWAKAVADGDVPPGDAPSDASEPPRTRRKTGSYRLSTRALDADYEGRKEELRDAAASVGVSRQPLDRAARRGDRQPPPRPPPPDFAAALPIVTKGPVIDPAPPQPTPQPPPAEKPEHEPPRPDLPELLTCLPGPVALFSKDESLIAVDLRRLRAFLVYRRLARDIGGGQSVAVQRLLSPVIVRRPKSEVTLCVEARAELLELGIDLDVFGDDAVVVRGVPGHLRNCIDDADVTDLIDRVVPWLRLRARGEGARGVARREVLSAIAETKGGDPAPRLARRWLGEAMELGESLESVPGVRRWSAPALVGRPS